MPYRRLPNTDASRRRAMSIALQKGKEIPPHKVPFSSKTLLRLERFLPEFENNIKLYRDTLSSQGKKNREYNEIVKKAKIYLTHFIRVMNMAIFRGELPAETRAFYGLATDESTVPSLISENEMMSWGRRIIEGEEFRIKKGGSPINNPTIAVVKVRFGNFLDALNQHKTLSRKTNEYSKKIDALRKEADDIILNVWNEVEQTYSTQPDGLKKELCEKYGLVYFYRKNENRNALTIEIHDQAGSISTSVPAGSDQDPQD